MLGILTHPIACVAYFIAFRTVIHVYLGESRTTWGFVGRTTLFSLASLAVSGAVILMGPYDLGGVDRASNLHIFLSLIAVLAPAILLAVTLLGVVACVLIKKYDKVFLATTVCMIGVQLALLWNLHGGF